MLTDGIPIIYQGQEQHLAGADDPGCCEAMWLPENGSYDTDAALYKFAAHLNKIRAWAVKDSGFATTKNQVLNYSGNQIAMRKGVVRSVLAFTGVRQEKRKYSMVGAGFEKEEKVVDVMGCRKYTADKKGEVVVEIGGGAVVVLMTAGNLKGSGLCAH